MNVGWKPSNVSTIGVRLVTKLSKCLWYIDPHWDKLVSRGVHMPVRFARFRGCNDFRQQKRKVTQLFSSVLNDPVQELSGLVMQPWFALDMFNELRNDIEQLADCLKVYEDYLIAQSCKVGEHHQIVTVQGSQDDNISLETMPSYDVPVLEEYYTLHQLLLATSFYQPKFLNDLAPRERYDRRKWLSGIQLPFPIMLYRFAYGNHLGALCYAWKIPDDKSVDNAAVSRVYSQLSKEQSTYSTRAMRREFLDHYTTLANVSPMVLRNIYKTLLHDSSSASNSFEKGMNERVAKAILEMDDPDIILDLRQTNGHVESSRFDSFWKELQFQCMKIKDVPVKLGVPATESEIEAQFKWVLSIDPTLDKERLSKMDLQNAASLQSFMKAHCHLSAYAFQVKKCCDNTCYYCSKHQIRLSHEDFKSLHFLPLPLLHPTNKDHYRPFSDVYGQLPSNLDQPSCY